LDKDDVASPVQLSIAFLSQPSVHTLKFEPLALAANLGSQVLLVLWRVGGIESLSEAAQTDYGVQRAQRIPNFVWYQKEVGQVHICFSAVGAPQRSHHFCL
jgi:hypothetical protein